MIRSVLRLSGAATFSLLTLIPSVADASEIDFRGVGHGATVTVAGSVRSGTFMAGELNWQWIGTTPDGFAQSFYSYCIDVANNLADGQTVTHRSSDGFTNGVANGGSKAAWLFNQFAAGIRANNTSSANTQAAALQIAIWEAMYDTSANLGGGNFRLTTTGSIRTQAQTYLTSLYSAGSSIYTQSVASVLEVARGDRGQDQIVAKVSEPSTLLLVGVAFLMFAKRARRDRHRTKI
jgi:hypothetical protein